MKQKIFQSLYSKRERMKDLLREVVEIQSGTLHPVGIGKVARIFERELRSMGLETQIVPGKDGYGEHLIAHRKGHGLRVVLDGHIDTVFPKDSMPRLLYENGVFRGQGVVDMKGGDVMLLFALRVLVELDLLKSLDVTVLFTGDEEHGGLTSQEIFEHMHEHVDLALLFEMAGDRGEIVISRRGRQVFSISAYGKAGHAGSIGIKRINAIDALACQIVSIRKIASKYTGILINPGVIRGGHEHNVICDLATIEYDARFDDRSEFDNFYAEVMKSFDSSCVEGARFESTLSKKMSMSQLTETPLSMKAAYIYQQIAKEEGHQIALERRGGGSNANWWGALGVSVLDGFGPIGGDDHSEREWMDEESFFTRTVWFSEFLVRLRESSQNGELDQYMNN